MEALEHHGLLAPGSTALDFDVRSLTFDPELGGYGGDKPKDKSYGRQVWGAMSQAVSTVATSVSEAGSDLYSTVQAAVSSFLNLKADEVLPLRYDAKFPSPVSPPALISIHFHQSRIFSLEIKLTGFSWQMQCQNSPGFLNFKDPGSSQSPHFAGSSCNIILLDQDLHIEVMVHSGHSF